MEYLIIGIGFIVSAILGYAVTETYLLARATKKRIKSMEEYFGISFVEEQWSDEGEHLTRGYGTMNRVEGMVNKVLKTSKLD